MTIILSLAAHDEERWAAGPQGLFQVNHEGLEPVPQPQERLFCVASLGDRILVGGAPHGVAYLHEAAEGWQAAWMDEGSAAVLCMAPAPDFVDSGLLLVGSEGDGILRSSDRGRRFSPLNFGLRSYTALAIEWAPPSPDNAQWPHREFVFAGTEEGIYRSPAGGRGWSRSRCDEAPYQAIAVSPHFHRDGLVLAGTDGSGLRRSQDGGRSFESVEGAPQQVNALHALEDGWLLSDETQIWHSQDGLTWEPVAGSTAALVFLSTESGLMTGTETGVRLLDENRFGTLHHYAGPELSVQ